VVIVAGEFVVEPGERDAFLASREEGMRRSRGEAGCLEYTFSADPLDPGRVLLFERWESQQALDAHLAALASAPGAGAAPAVAPKRSEIKLFDVTGERSLG
jgi:quinol monooxygenase YgiN